MTDAFKQFFDLFNENEKNAPETEQDVHSFEKKYQIKLPVDYRYFLLTYGDLWTPDVVNVIDDNHLEIDDVQQFLPIDRILHDKEFEWTAKLHVDMIPIASDCMGNIFGFMTEDLKVSNGEPKIYLFDHDFDTIEPVSNSLKDWIIQFVDIDKF